MKDEKKCKTCGGTGEIDWGIVAPPNFIPPSKTTPCEDCNGSGVQPEDKLDEITRPYNWDKYPASYQDGYEEGYKSASEPRDKRIKELEKELGELKHKICHPPHNEVFRKQWYRQDIVNAIMKEKKNKIKELEERLKVAEAEINRLRKSNSDMGWQISPDRMGK